MRQDRPTYYTPKYGILPVAQHESLRSLGDQKGTSTDMTRTGALSLSFFFLLSGCVTASVTKLTNTDYPKIRPEEVVIYLSEDDVPKVYDQVALIYTKGDYAATKETGQFKKARKRAAKLGANGIIFGEMTEPKSGAKVANFVFGTPANRKGQMMAIFVHVSQNESD